MTEQFTAQFNHLLKEKDSFNAATAAAERERRREEQILSGHRTAAQQIAEQLNVAKSNDGETSRKLQNLRESKLRLTKQIEVDRAGIVKVTNELRGKESEEKKQKWKFVKEMEGINDELDDLLCKAEDEKTLRLIDADTVQWLLETKMSMMNHSEGMDENYVEAENEKWRVVQSKIEEGLSALVEAREKLDVQFGEKQQLENMLVEHREKFKAMFTHIHQDDIDALEVKWDETIVLENNDHEDPADNDGDEMPPNKSNEASVTDPVHMDMFYHDQ
eukprot:scaffold98249_cov49-Cyclotella_meneghiniana.AAC.1